MFLTASAGLCVPCDARQVKKGMSLEQKREECLKVFTESAEFFNAKEVEKLASKRGLPAQTVKDVLQSLVDDNMVVVDKIGIGNYYWAFPSAVGQKRKAALAGLEDGDRKSVV